MKATGGGECGAVGQSRKRNSARYDNHPADGDDDRCRNTRYRSHQAVEGRGSRGNLAGIGRLEGGVFSRSIDGQRRFHRHVPPIRRFDSGPSRLWRP